jgi:AcrR family transcriptional regulator
MSVTVIDISTDVSHCHPLVVDARLPGMGRWQPDARGRMIAAAMELFAERGFEQTTAGDIAERAGVTERTFFRHFTDKREVLFDGSPLMAQTAHDAILDAPDSVTPLEAALAGMVAGGGMLEDRREHAVRRNGIIPDGHRRPARTRRGRADRQPRRPQRGDGLPGRLRPLDRGGRAADLRRLRRRGRGGPALADLTLSRTGAHPV